MKAIKNAVHIIGREFKDFASTVFGHEYREFKSLSKKQKKVYIYFVLSLALFITSACCIASIWYYVLVVLNLVNAIYLGVKHIPGFMEEDI